MQGDLCKEFKSGYNQIYIGPFESNYKQGLGVLLDLDEQEIFEGEFGSDKRNGVGTTYQRDGKVFSVAYKHGKIEGGLNFIKLMTKHETAKKFKDALKGHFVHVK